MGPGKWEGKVSQAETCKDKDGREEKVCCGGERGWGGTQREAGMRALQWLEGGDVCKQPSGHLRSQQTHI